LPFHSLLVLGTILLFYRLVLLDSLDEFRLHKGGLASKVNISTVYMKNIHTCCFRAGPPEPPCASSALILRFKVELRALVSCTRSSRSALFCWVEASSILFSDREWRSPMRAMLSLKARMESCKEAIYMHMSQGIW
jgi:hypothetical protein